MKYNNFPLSPIFLDFLRNDCKKEFLEGTTLCGKTTVGGCFKYIYKVAQDKEPLHCICGKSKGIIEKNIINAGLGIKDIWGNRIEYKGNGTKENSIPHLILHTQNGDKIIYLAAYDNVSSYSKVVGSQYGCVLCDEMNLANPDFLREMIMRCNYFLGTMNPDNAQLECYKDYVNHARPKDKWKDRVPQSIMEDLEECKPYNGWDYWFFTFNDNLSLTDEMIDERKRSAGTGKIYKNKILGLRGTAEGQCLDAFDRNKNVISYNALKKLIKETEENSDRKKRHKFFKYFTAGLDTSYSKKSDDTIALTFLGIDFTGTCYLLDEYVINNKDLEGRISPSDLCVKIKEFLDKNKEEWGYCSTLYVDNADAATLSELEKYRRKQGLIYNFEPCFKKKIIDRIYQMNGWFADQKYMICETCFNHIEELENYSWKDGTNKQESEDRFNHTIDSVNYAIYPFENEIGGI